MIDFLVDNAGLVVGSLISAYIMLLLRKKENRKSTT